jgi:hypothetical protein
VSNPTSEFNIVFLKFHPGSTACTKPAASQIAIKVSRCDVE